MGNIGMQYGLFRTMIWGISEDNMGRNSLYKACFNSHLHLFRENILSKFSQKKLQFSRPVFPFKRSYRV